MKWIKVLTTLHRVPKVRRLRESDRWRYVACLSLAGERDSENGELPEMRDLAMHLNVAEKSLRSSCDRIVAEGLFEWGEDHDHVIILQWARHQFTGKYRQKKYRDKPKDEKEDPLRNGDVTVDNSYALDKNRIDKIKEEKEERHTSVDTDAVRDSWNAFATLHSLPQVRKMSDKRKKAVRRRYAEVWPEIEAIYDKIRASDFLLGKNGGWVISFDFLWCQADSATKILEGKYDNRQATGHSNGQDRRSSQERLNQLRVADIKHDANSAFRMLRQLRGEEGHPDRDSGDDALLIGDGSQPVG